MVYENARIVYLLGPPLGSPRYSIIFGLAMEMHPRRDDSREVNQAERVMLAALRSARRLLALKYKCGGKLISDDELEEILRFEYRENWTEKLNLFKLAASCTHQDESLRIYPRFVYASSQELEYLDHDFSTLGALSAHGRDIIHRYEAPS